MCQSRYQIPDKPTKNASQPIATSRWREIGKQCSLLDSNLCQPSLANRAMAHYFRTAVGPGGGIEF